MNHAADPSASNPSFYETPRAISEYLLFHYGEDEAFLLDGIGPRDALGFARRCGALSLRHPVGKTRALDLGCAVGGSACELSAHFAETIGIDYSHGLIEAARAIASGTPMEAKVADEGDLQKTLTLRAPQGTRPERLTFEQGDATNLRSDLGRFDFVLMANLIDRLPSPRRCLESLHSLLKENGIVAITSPYTWLEEYTPKEEWLGGYIDANSGKEVRTYETLQRLLEPHFEEIEALNLPFLIREHSRKNQYSIAHATLWRKK